MPRPASRARLDPRAPGAASSRGARCCYDKSGEEHYNLISALHKSLRNSDPDAAVYWLARMLESGEDLMYVARRLVRFASEDIGNADPQALVVAIAAQQAAHFLGMPEANTALAQAAIYLAAAPKSNAVYAAYNEAADAARRDEADPVPLHLRNAPTRLMKQLDYGKGYEYAHDAAEGGDGHGLPAGPRCRAARYYRPTDRGFEKEIARRLEGWREIKKKRQEREDSDERWTLNARTSTRIEGDAVGRRVPSVLHESTNCSTTSASAFVDSDPLEVLLDLPPREAQHTGRPCGHTDE